MEDALARRFREVPSLLGAADLVNARGRICGVWADGRVHCARDAGDSFEEQPLGRVAPGSRFLKERPVLPNGTSFDLCVTTAGVRAGVAEGVTIAVATSDAQAGRPLCTRFRRPSEVPTWLPIDLSGALTAVEGEDEFGLAKDGVVRSTDNGTTLRVPPVARASSAPPARLFALRDGRYGAGWLMHGAPDLVRIYDAPSGVVDVAFAGTHAFPCLLDRASRLRCGSGPRWGTEASSLCGSQLAEIPEVVTLASGSMFGLCAMVASGQTLCVVPWLSARLGHPPGEVIPLHASPEIRRIVGVSHLCYQRSDGAVACARSKDVGAPQPDGGPSPTAD